MATKTLPQASDRYAVVATIDGQERLLGTAPGTANRAELLSAFLADFGPVSGNRLRVMRQEDWFHRGAPAEPIPVDPVAEDRARLVASLRELADYLAAHPEVPVYDGTTNIGFSVDRGDGDEAAIARVRVAASALGVEAREYSPGYWHARRMFGCIEYGCGYIARETWARVVATESYRDAVEPGDVS